MKKNLFVAICLAGAALSGTGSLAAATISPAVSTPVAAYPNPSFIIPGIGHLDGAGGSHWSSSIQATNHDTAAATLTACYTPNTTPAQGSCLTINLGPGQSVTLDDIVGSNYQLPGTFGLFQVNAGSTDPAKVEVTGDTLNKITDPASPINGGIIGTGMRALAPADLLHTDGIPIFIPTSGTSGTQRQNLNWYSTTGGTANVILFDHVGNTRGTTTISLGPISTQAPLYGVNGLFNVAPQDNDYLEITLVNSASIPFATFGASLAIVNNDSLNSVTIVLPTKLTNATNRLYILGAGKLPGASNTFFTTNLQVQNLSHTSLNGFNMYFFQSGQPNITPVNTSDTLINNEVKTYRDVTTTLFGLATPNLGALDIESLGEPLLANATINNNVIRNGVLLGQIGLNFAGVTTSIAARSKSPTLDNTLDQISNTVNGMTNSTGTRTNLGLVNTSYDPETQNNETDPVGLNITIMDGATGQPVAPVNGAQNPYHLMIGAHEQLQVSLVSIIGDQPLTNAYAVITPDDNCCIRPAILTYGVRVDNISGQGIVLPGQPLNTTPPPTTGEQYVHQYLDPLQNRSFYLTNAETRCQIRDCGVPVITDALAAIYVRGIGETWTAAQAKAALLQITDGITSPSNPELWGHEDPFTWSANGGVGYTITTSQTQLAVQPGDVLLTPADRALAWQQIRGFLVNYVNAHPEEYCGTPISGPNLACDPTWSSRDAN